MLKIIINDLNIGNINISRTLKFINIAGINGTLLNFAQSFDKDYLPEYVLYVLDGVSIIEDGGEPVYLGVIPDNCLESIFFKYDLDKQNYIWEYVLNKRRETLQKFSINIDSTYKLDPLSPVSWVNESIKQRPDIMSCFRIYYPDMPYQDLIGLVNVLILEGYITVPEDFKKELSQITGGK